jgi:hypothetical protein
VDDKAKAICFQLILARPRDITGVYAQMQHEDEGNRRGWIAQRDETPS